MNNAKRYYVKEAGFDNLMNAGILRSQNEAILEKLNFEAINPSYSISFFQRLKSWFEMIRWLFKLKQQDLVIFHFPFHSSKNKLLLKLLSKKNIPIAVIIVDIDGLRDNDEKLLKEEINLLKQFKWVIAHNEAMKHFLEQKLPSKKIISIGLFDYKVTEAASNTVFQDCICFAGNIEKSSFIYSLNNTEVNIYGLGFDKSKSKENLYYQGAFDAATLPSKLEGSYGLVWDGEEINHCHPYLQYNNPHKLSLYLAAGMPVIVWDKSAVADLVLQENIGITIKNLADLKNKLNTITTAAYQQMQQNAASIGIQLKSGFFLKQVISRLTEEVSSN